MVVVEWAQQQDGEESKSKINQVGEEFGHRFKYEGMVAM